MRKISIFLVLLVGLSFLAKAQTNFIDYSAPKKYILSGVNITGVEYLSADALIMISGLEVGGKIDIPGEQISLAINKLWQQGLFSDVQISIIKVQSDSVWLDIYLKEQPRLYNVKFYGINSSQETDLREKLDLTVGKHVTDNMLNTSEIVIKKYFADKGFPMVEVSFKTEEDTVYQNTVNLSISIDKKNRVKIENISIVGNKSISDNKIKRFLKETKQQAFWRFWKSSKYIEDKYIDDKKNIIDKYKNLGYRDARILEDSVFVNANNKLNVYMKIDEGTKYYFRNIEFIGNTKYSTELLNRVLDIKKGDPYDQNKLQNRLYTDETALGNLYYDDGYLFYSALPQEYNIENDSVDLRIIIYEGQQAKINNVIISGNTRTNDYVIRRELKTFPGELFSKTDLMRSVRALANIGNFDPEQLNPNPVPDQSNGTVDIKYGVVERPNDMFELSGGFGYYGLMLQVGISFNNFSMRNIFKPKAWDPLPIGDGEKFSINVTTSGLMYQVYSVSYSNPWFGRKKPNNFSVSAHYNHFSNATVDTLKATQHFNVLGVSVGFGERLKFPDDYFVWNSVLAFDNYSVKDYNYYLKVGNGKYNLFSLTNTISRSSIDNPLFTRSGSNFSVSLKTTPPYSLITNNKSWTNGSDSLKFKWSELYRLDINGQWFSELFKNLVLMTRFDFGVVGFYNKDIGYTPFEGFDVGGSGFAGYYTVGVDYIGLRGYKDHTIANGQTSPAKVYAKYSVELRYPLLLKEMANLYVLGFLEAGNGWYSLKSFNPFDVKRSAGVGARLYVPMLGLVGFDVGYGFDTIQGNASANKWNYHFTFGQHF